MADLPSNAQVVIVGGGIVGCSIAYHLTMRGRTDVVLLERKQLTCGTTWHAAGLVGQLRATHNLTRLAQYTTELYASLEEETGQATGFRQIGSIALATTDARFEELKRGASMARCFGLEVEVLTPARRKELWPLMAVDDLVGAVHLPKDGQTNPVDTTQALAKGARSRGARIVENVEGHRDRRRGRPRCRRAHRSRRHSRRMSWSTAAGMWARELGAAAGVPCRCMPPSTSTSSPSRCPACRASCRCCATPTTAPTSRRMPASCWSAGSSRWPSPGA